MMLDFSTWSEWNTQWCDWFILLICAEYWTPDAWTVFMRQDFSCQKSDIPETAIGWDYAGEK